MENNEYNSDQQETEAKEKVIDWTFVFIAFRFIFVILLVIFIIAAKFVSEDIGKEIKDFYESEFSVDLKAEDYLDAEE